MSETPTTSPEARYSPLYEVHVAAGASFTDFAGWQMPVRYSGDLAEYHAVRTAAGLGGAGLGRGRRGRGAFDSVLVDGVFFGHVGVLQFVAVLLTRPHRSVMRGTAVPWELPLCRGA